MVQWSSALNLGFFRILSSALSWMDIAISIFSSLVRGSSNIGDPFITIEGYMVETPRGGLTIGEFVTCPSGVFETIKSVLVFEELSFEFAKESTA